MNICTPGRRRKDVTVVCNTLKVNADVVKLSDGLEALIWLLKKMGGRAHYGAVLREIRNPRKFGNWLTERFEPKEGGKGNGRS